MTSNAPKDILLSSNRMVLVFDTAGEQIPELQGCYDAVLPLLKQVDLSQCQFLYYNWLSCLQKPLTQAEFFDLSSVADSSRLVFYCPEA